MRKLRVAVIGQGRSGRDIHSAYFLSEENKNVEVVYVVDELQIRRENAKKVFSCPILTNYQELFGKNDEIDLVVNSSYSQQHYAITKDLLCHGFNVLVEKPFGRTSYECYDLIATAKKHNVIVTGFHQTLIVPSFLEIKEIIDSGKLGDVFQISLKYSGFARRWDWQTLQACCAGSVFNSGPHPIGQALAFLGWDKNVRVAYSDLKTVITSGDAEDYGKIILTAPNKFTVDIEICSVDAFAGDFTFKVFGSKGTLVASNADYKIKRVEMEKLPPRPVIRESLMGENGEPSYCSESLPFIEETGEFGGSAFDQAVKDFYDMMYDTIINGKPLKVTPEMAAEVVRIIEICHAQNPLPVKYEA